MYNDENNAYTIETDVGLIQVYKLQRRK